MNEEFKIPSSNVWEWSLNHKKELKEATKNNCTELFHQLKNQLDQTENIPQENIDKIFKRITNEVKKNNENYPVYLKFLSELGSLSNGKYHPAIQAIEAFKLTNRVDYVKWIPNLIESHPIELTFKELPKILDFTFSKELNEMGNESDMILNALSKKNNLNKNSIIINNCLYNNNYQFLGRYIDEISVEELEKEGALYKALAYHVGMPLELIEMLLDKGVNLSTPSTQQILLRKVKDPHLLSLILTKIKEKNPDNKKLIEFLTIKDTKGDTLLHNACEGGNPVTANLILQEILAINNKIEGSINLYERNNNDETPIDIALKDECHDIISLFLNNKDFNPLSKDENGNTLLHLACLHGNSYVVKQLLKREDIQQELKENQMINSHNLSPLHLARTSQVAQLMVTKGGLDPNLDIGAGPPIIFAINNVEVMEKLISLGADVNQRALNGKTALHIACEKDLLDIVELLLKNEASVEKVDGFGYTPLYYAYKTALETYEYNTCDLVFEKFMENFTEDTSSPTLPGNRTLLHYACGFEDKDKRFQFVEKLINAGHPLNQRDEQGATPILNAAFQDDLELVKYLHQKGALLNIRGDAGKMLIEIPIDTKNDNFIQYFIENVPLEVGDKESVAAYAYIYLYRNELDKLDDLLKEFSKNVRPQDVKELKTTLMRKACYANNFEAVNMLFNHFQVLTRDLFSDIFSYDEFTDPRIVQILIEHGAHPYEEKLMYDTDIPSFIVAEALSAILKSQSEDAVINVSETSDVLTIKEALRSNLDKIMGNENPLKIPFYFRDKNSLALIKGMISEADFAKHQDSLLEEFGENAENFVFGIDQAHFEKGLTVETPLPPAPQGVEFGELSEMFKEINFTEPEKSGYKDPLFITNEGKSRSPADLQKAIDWLIKRTKERLTKDEQGNPLAGIPKDAEKHYDLWTLYLLHITNEIKKLEPNDKANHLIEVAKWGEFCNGKITSASYEARELLGLIKVGDQGVEPEICQDLKNFQLGYFEKAAKNSTFGYSMEIHYYNQLRYLLQDKLHLPEKDAYNEEDPYAEYMKLNVSTEKIYENFLRFYYTPQDVIDFMRSTWEGELDKNIIKKEEDLIRYLRDNPDPSFDKENYEKKLKLIQSEKPRAEILQEFKETFGYALATGDTSPVEAVREARKLDYKRNYKQPSLEEWNSDFYDPLFEQIETMISEKVADEDIYRFLEEKGLKFEEKEKTPLDTLKEHRRLERFYSEVEESDYRPDFYEKIMAELEGKPREEQIKILKENDIPIKNDMELKSILDASRGMDYVDSVLKYKKVRDEEGKVVKNERGFARTKANLDRRAVRHLAKKFQILES